MNTWFRKSLKHKLSVLLLISIMVPLLSLGFFTFKIASNITEENAKEAGMNSLEQLGSNLTLMFQDVENMSLFMIGQRDVQSFLNNDELQPVSSTRLIGFLSNLVFFKSYISDISIFPIDGSTPVSNSTIMKSGLQEALGDFDGKSPPSEIRWTSLYENQTLSGLKRVVSLYRPIRNYNTFEQTANLSISIDQEAIAKLLSQSRLDPNGIVLLLDDRSRVIAGGPDEWRMHTIRELYPGIISMSGETGIANYKESGTINTVLYRTLQQPAGWKVVGIIPYDEYKAQNRYVLKLTAISVAISVLLIAALVLFFVQRVTRPLVAVTNYLKDANPENPIPTYQITSPDEVGQLIRSYNRLNERILNLTEQVRHNEILKKEADMRALQAQINPHFLYNTLSSIHWIALMNKDSQIAEMVGSLSDFLRFSLNRGEEFCTIQQEISHAQNYTNIQSIRFPHKFGIRFFIDPEIHDEKILKLLLQPLIENALIHGIQKQPGEGSIDIHVNKEGGSLKVLVEDNGIGMSETRLNQIRDSLDNPEQSDGGSYGLRNVHRRLQLHYGGQSGLSIYSKEGKGTRIEFQLPLTKEPNA